MDGWVNSVPTESKMREYCPQTAGNSLSETQKLKNFQKNSKTIPGAACPKPPHVHVLNVCSCFNDRNGDIYVINITLTSKYNDGNSCSSRVIHV